MKTAIFALVVNMILNHEGGYVNNPRDPGGETKFGISKATYPHLNIKSLTREQAKDIYYRDFWLKYKINEIPGKFTAAKVMDIFVQFNPKTAATIIQKAINFLEDECDGVKVDGIYGVNTRLALVRCHRRVGDEVMACAISGFHFARYVDRVQESPKSKAFVGGWTRRAIMPAFECLNIGDTVQAAIDGGKG